MTGTRAHRIILLLLITVSVLCAGCERGSDETPAPTLEPSMKGYELYSWYAGPDWHYALVAGSNRIKTFDELSAPDVVVEGVVDLKDELMRLPEGESVFWSTGRVPGTVLAPPEVVDEIRLFCESNAISLEFAD